MNKREGIKLVSELEAERILLGLGHTKDKCAACDGAGYFIIGGKDLFFGTAQQPEGRHACVTCEGATWVWKAPDPHRNVAPIPPPDR